jgi:hypothetical protein
VHVVIAEHSLAVVPAERQVEATIGEDAVDHAQIIKHFQATGLQAFAPRSGEVFRSFVDDTETQSAPGQLAGKSEPSGACSHDEYADIPVLRHSVPRQPNVSNDLLTTDDSMPVVFLGIRR